MHCNGPKKLETRETVCLFLNKLFEMYEKWIDELQKQEELFFRLF